MASNVKGIHKTNFLMDIIIYLFLIIADFFAILTIIVIHDGTIEIESNGKIADFVMSEFTDLCHIANDKTYHTAGSYDIDINCFYINFKRTVNVIDTTPPVLNTKKFVTYKNDVKPEDFVEYVNDSSKYNLSLLGEFDFNTKEEQYLTLVAEDEFGNKTSKEVTLLFDVDKEPPKMYGMSTITIMENELIDYYDGVTAIDELDGECKFTVDYSEVDREMIGTYYATYSTSDLSGNAITFKRKIIVVERSETNELVADFYKKYLKGKSIYDMTMAVRKKISYAHNSGGDDPVYYGLKYRTGNCFVHAQVLKALLDYAGYENMIVYNTSNTHAWNLVYADGHWRHYDPTNGNVDIGPSTDKDIENSPNKKWDRKKYPKAE